MRIYLNGTKLRIKKWQKGSMLEFKGLYPVNKLVLALNLLSLLHWLEGQMLSICAHNLFPFLLFVLFVYVMKYYYHFPVYHNPRFAVLMSPFQSWDPQVATSNIRMNVISSTARQGQQSRKLCLLQTPKATTCKGGDCFSRHRSIAIEFEKFNSQKFNDIAVGSYVKGGEMEMEML